MRALRSYTCIFFKQRVKNLRKRQIKWSEWRDLNPRPPGPKPGTLPNCATLRKNSNYTLLNAVMFNLFFLRVLKISIMLFEFGLIGENYFYLGAGRIDF